MVVTSRRNSIYFQLFSLLLIAAVAVSIIFVVINNIGVTAIENYYYDSGYDDKKNEEYIDKLQAYVNKNDISTSDIDELKKWIKQQKLINLRLYKDDKIIFDSDYPDEDLVEAEIESSRYDWETYYLVEFSDGTAEVGITGTYEYQLYNIAFIAELIFSFALFVIIVLLGIKRKMKYISKLSSEIAILEGGSLDYEITVKGNDELSVLADGLESMRKSFIGMIESETQMVNENKKIITEMSHDLRTPVTSIMIYTEILKKGKYKDEKQLIECLDKIDKKTRRMKQLTDHLFEYALVSGEQEIELEEPESCEIIFYDLFSETCSYLNQNGFNVEFNVDCQDKNIRVYTEYIVRILDNISSNIIKYADPENKVIISSVCTENMVGFRFENTEKVLTEKIDSNKVGIQSIKNMMKKMDGNIKTTNENGVFAVEILFPCVKV